MVPVVLTSEDMKRETREYWYGTASHQSIKINPLERVEPRFYNSTIAITKNIIQICSSNEEKDAFPSFRDAMKRRPGTLDAMKRVVHPRF